MCGEMRDFCFFFVVFDVVWVCGRTLAHTPNKKKKEKKTKYK